jgi:hypothetical protein
MGMKKLVVRLALVGTLIGGMVIFILFNKPHRDPSKEEAKISLTSEEIQASFSKDMEMANSLYIDNVVELTGVVTEVAEFYCILDNLVIANLAEGESLPALDIHVKIKGRVVGYDDLFEQVQIDFATIE